METLAIDVSHREQAKVRVYPNPARERICVSNLQPGSEVTIYDAKGVMMKTHLKYAGQELTIDCATFTPGVYYVVVRGSGKAGREVSKVIIMR
jgi:hypothetical protein